MMLFNEVYSSYFSAVAEIVAAAVRGTLSREQLNEIVRKKGFAESTLTIPQNLTNGTWPLLKPDYTTPLKNVPSMPLTLLQKRWLKALLQDPRIRLFGVTDEGLEEVQPLYDARIFEYYDRYNDADPFDDPQYIEHFRTILTALREKRKLNIRFTGHQNTRHSWVCVPYRLEYSSKDDKFRVISSSLTSTLRINVARITGCSLLEPYTQEEYNPKPPRKKTLILNVRDERNTLERVLLHFSHLEKEAERTSGNTYRVRLRYEQADETELVIRVLSFGPMLRVLSPDDFIQKITERLDKQEKLRT